MMAAASPTTFNPSISAYTLMTAVIVLIRKKRHSPALLEQSIRNSTVHLHRHARSLAVKGFRNPYIHHKRVLKIFLFFFLKNYSVFEKFTSKCFSLLTASCGKNYERVKSL